MQRAPFSIPTSPALFLAFGLVCEDCDDVLSLGVVQTPRLVGCLRRRTGQCRTSQVSTPHSTTVPGRIPNMATAAADDTASFTVASAYTALPTHTSSTPPRSHRTVRSKNNVP